MDNYPQTPTDLLEDLQQAIQRYPPERGKPQLAIIDELLKFEETLGHDRAQIEQKIEKYYLENGDWAKELFLEVIKNFPEEARGIFANEDFFAIGTLDKIDVNAEAIRAPNGGWLIVLHHGLFTFLYKIARALATRFVAEGENGKKPYGDASIDFEEMCHLIVEVFAWYAQAGIPFSPDFPIHPAQISIANLLATYAETFIICHEIAHHALGHVKSGTEKNIIFGNKTVQVKNWAWDDEFEADQLGLRLLLGEGDRQGESNNTVMRYTGADFFFQVMAIFEELAGVQYTETHPPSSERLTQLRNYAKSLCSDEASKNAILQRAMVIEQLLTSVRKTLFSPTQEYSQYLNRKSQLISSQLDEILDKHSGGMVPDYYGFYEDINQLLEKGPSDVLANTISQRLSSYRRYLENLKGQQSKNNDWVIFQKFKLLIGFLEHLPPEVKQAIYPDE